MNPIHPFLPSPQTALYLGNVALAVLRSCAAASLAAVVCRRRSAPTRHGVLFLGLVLALTSPELDWLAGRAGIGQIHLALGRQHAPIDTPEAFQDAQRRPLDVPRERPAQEQPALVQGPPAPVADRPVVASQASVEPSGGPRFEPVPLPSADSPAIPQEIASVATAPWWRSLARGVCAGMGDGRGGRPGVAGTRSGATGRVSPRTAGAPPRRACGKQPSRPTAHVVGSGPVEPRFHREFAGIAMTRTRPGTA